MKAAQLLGHKPRKRPRHLEDAEQVAFFQWADLATVNGVKVGDYCFHVPNGGKRNPREAARFKKMGVRAGVSDIIMLYPMGGFHGLIIELKAANGKMTSDQVKWQGRMGDVGYFVVTCWGFESAKKTVEDYLSCSK